MSDLQPSEQQVGAHTITVFTAQLKATEQFQKRDLEALIKPYGRIEWLNHKYQFLLIIVGDHDHDPKFAAMLKQVRAHVIAGIVSNQTFSRFTRLFLTLMPDSLDWHLYDERFDQDEIESLCFLGNGNKQVQLDFNATLGLFFLSSQDQAQVVHLWKRCLALKAVPLLGGY